MTVREAIRYGTKQLERSGLPRETAERETRLILSHLLKVKPLNLLLIPDEEVPEEFFELVSKRALRIPLAYLLEEVEFYGRPFKVREGVFVPRPETEVLVETFLKVGPKEGLVLELGTGTGVIPITCLLENERLEFVSVDISEKALSNALENAKAHGVSSRLFLVRGDWTSPFKSETFSAIVSNPPYIGCEERNELEPEVRDFEPPEALFAGGDGLLFVKRTLLEGKRLLKPGGKIFLELGYAQREKVEALCFGLKYGVGFVKDLCGIWRVAVVDPWVNT